MNTERLREMPVLSVCSWLMSGGDSSRLSGAKLIHKSRGMASLVFKETRNTSNVFRVTFCDGGTRECSVADLKDTRWWINILVPAELAEDISDLRNDPFKIPEQKEYQSLRKKYDVSLTGYTWLVEDRASAVWQVFDILRKMESEAQWYPQSGGISLLEELKLNRALALLFERRFNATGDAGDTARASRHWRIIKAPRLAIAATDPVAKSCDQFDRPAAAAALLSRAAAFLDINRHTDAEDALRTAMALGAPKELTDRVWFRLHAKAR